MGRCPGSGAAGRAGRAGARAGPADGRAGQTPGAARHTRTRRRADRKAGAGRNAAAHASRPPRLSRGAGRGRPRGDHLHGPAHAGPVAERAERCRPGVAAARPGRGDRLADGLRPEQEKTAARQRVPRRVRFGHGGHLCRQRAVHLRTLRRRRACRRLLLPPVPQARPRRRHDRLVARRLSDLLHVRARASAGGGRAGRRRDGGGGPRPRRGRPVPRARGCRAARPALRPCARPPARRARAAREAEPADVRQTGERGRWPRPLPRGRVEHRPSVARVRGGVRLGGGELGLRLRGPGLRDPRDEPARSVARAAARLRRGRRGGQHRDHPGGIRPRRADPDRCAERVRPERLQSARRGTRLPAGQFLAGARRGLGRHGGPHPPR